MMQVTDKCLKWHGGTTFISEAHVMYANNPPDHSYRYQLVGTTEVFMIRAASSLVCQHER